MRLPANEKDCKGLLWDIERFNSLMLFYIDGPYRVITVGNVLSLEWACAR